MSLILNLERKKVVVTGGANGIGCAISSALLDVGAFPIIVDVKPLNGSELQGELTEKGYKERVDYDFIQGDASNKKIMTEALKKYEEFSALVNNAGLLGNDEQRGGRTAETFFQMVIAHALTTYVMTDLVASKMVNGGSIVNIGSIETEMAAPGVAAYNAGKGAQKAMAITDAGEYGRKKSIRVNTVSPGYVDTKANRERYSQMPAEQSKAELETLRARTILEIVTPEQVANVVLFLLSPMSVGVTGQNIVIDGGYSINLLNT